MGEYAVVTATVASVVIVALSGVGRSLPTSNAQAQAAVSRGATASHVSPAAARQALARAPYRRVQLRTLFALGWVAGVKERATCLIATTTGGSTEAYTREALRKLPDLRGLLRRSHVTEQQAVRAVDRGFRSSCPV